MKLIAKGYTITDFKSYYRDWRYIMGNKLIDYTALTIAIIGAVNWGLIGLFRFDLVAFLFGDMSWLSRIVYGLVGLCGLYLITFYMDRDRVETM